MLTNESTSFTGKRPWLREGDLLPITQLIRGGDKERKQRRAVEC